MTNNFSSNKTNYQKPRLSTEEWKNKKKEEKDAVYKMIDETAMAVSRDAESFRQYLTTQAKMNRYSSANALLIFRQRPNATQLKDFEDWGAEKVSVNKGEKSISILEPVEYAKRDGSTGISYNVKKMFDISQTNAPQSPVSAVNPSPRQIIAAMVDSSPVNVEVVNTLQEPDTGAFYDHGKNTLYVKKDINDSVTLCQCVALELAHAELAAENSNYTRPSMGFQAMCIGYMLCTRYGVEAKSYTISRMPERWQKMNSKEIRNELTKIRNTMNTIQNRMAEVFQNKTQERSHEKER